MSDPKPTRSQGDLAEMLETLLDKGVVINADVAVTIGDTELLGVRLRAAVASFETAARYGLEFPGGTDMERVADAAGVEPLEASDAGERAREVPVRTPSTPPAGGADADVDGSAGDEAEAEAGAGAEPEPEPEPETEGDPADDGAVRPGAGAEGDPGDRP